MKFRDRYKFDSSKDFIGKGGFARVYKAKDTIRNRVVALKFYKGMESGKYDIISEINRMDDMAHPNLIRYFDATIIPSVNAIGEKEDIQVGILEYANAGDISIFFKKKRDKATYYTIILGILKGLQYLHDSKIAHRDLKPKNILLSQKRGGYIAKIADFGISKKIGGLDDSAVSSQLLGSVEYMSPEQFAPAVYGIDGKLGTNVDLWSLGIIIYEIFAGQLPFGSRTQGITYEQILNNILFQDLEINYDLLPKPYDEIVRRCLVKHAGKRCRNANELIDILEGRQKRPTIDEGTETSVLTPPSEGTETSILTPPRNRNQPKTEPEIKEPENTTQSKPTHGYYVDEEPNTKEHKEATTADTGEDKRAVVGNSKSILHEINVGKNLFKLGNYTESFKILNVYQHNKEFDTESKFYLGYMYYNGKCGGEHDPVKGRKMMKEAQYENRPLILELMLKYVLN
ncbi:MAG: serine/threonine-protein kinase [Chitinophagales bacterium]